MTTGTVVTPASAWTGGSSWSGGKYLVLDPGETDRFDLVLGQRSVVEPVVWQEEDGITRTRWRQDGAPLGTLRHRIGVQDITAAPGALLPQRLPQLVRPGAGPVGVSAGGGTVRLDALLIRPVVSSLALSGAAGATELRHSASTRTEAFRSVRSGSVPWCESTTRAAAWSSSEW